MTVLLRFLLLLSLNCIVSSSEWTTSISGRFSFSLSTFNEEGRLAQVEHAHRAASLGPPVVAVSLTDGDSGGDCIMASLYRTPSPLVDDDGTARFVRISDTIAVAHSGVSADGRAVIAAAQRLAVEHAYTFESDGVDDGPNGEMMPIELFLEEMSQLFQRYTMKPASRPFGCSLLVVHIPPPFSNTNNSKKKKACRLYRIDPSGMVQLFEPICCIGGGGDGKDVAEKIVERLEERKCSNASSIEKAESILLEVMREICSRDEEHTASEAADGPKTPGPAFLISTLTRSRGLEVRKVHPAAAAIAEEEEDADADDNTEDR